MTNRRMDADGLAGERDDKTFGTNSEQGVMEHLIVEGHRVAFVDRGQGPALVFLHNGGTSHSIWTPLMRLLSAKRRVVAVDLPGYGASDHPPGGATMQTHVAMVDRLVQELGLGAPVLVGNCMGSAIALTYAQRRPGRVRALVLMNPLTEATLDAGLLAPFLRFRKKLPGLARAVYAAAGRLRLPRWSAGPVLSTFFGDRGRAQGLKAHAPLVQSHASRGHLRSLLSVLEDIDAYAALDSFRKPPQHPPTMVIWGRQNRVLSAEAGARLNETLAPERSEVLDETGHLLMLEAPEQVAEKIESFLSSLGEGAQEAGRP